MLGPMKNEGKVLRSVNTITSGMPFSQMQTISSHVGIQTMISTTQVPETAPFSAESRRVFEEYLAFQDNKRRVSP